MSENREYPGVEASVEQLLELGRSWSRAGAQIGKTALEAVAGGLRATADCLARLGENLQKDERAQ